MNIRKILLLSAILITGFYGVSLINATNLHTMSVLRIVSVNDDIIVHTIAKGETVYSIAAAYNTTVQQIYILNPGAEDGIREGDKLRVPKGKTILGYSNHIIEAKETFFSVSRMYNISVDDVKDANPGLTESSFSIGRTIKIPKFGAVGANAALDIPSEYRVQKGETLYSIGIKYNVSVEALLASNPILKEGGLKEGMLLTIPGQRPQTIAAGYKPGDSQTAALSASKGETVRIGIFFSFTDDNSSIQKDKLAEYYEGFLLAVRDMKEKGLNAEIYTFDIGPEKDTRKLESLLGTGEVKNLHLMIGGTSKQQIDVLSKFSEKNDIKYVIPFGQTSEINHNPALYQMTTSHSSLHSEIISAFADRFNNHTVVFVSGQNNDKADFVAELKKSLSERNIRHKTITESDNLADALKSSLGSGKNILIPVSSSEPALRRLITVIGAINASSVSLFGYPEWQAYTQHTAALHRFDSYIYSIFFLNEQQKEVRDVANQYKLWYNKNMINSFPKWGYLGYDTGLYFLTALKQYGSHFESNLENVKVQTLQSAIHFKRVNSKKDAGYVNNGIYFVHYKTDSGIEKTDISK